MSLLASRLQEEIRSHGPITFARFMERALYEPGLGYYEHCQEIGRRGDFFTSVSVGSLFGELLAFQFAEWLSEGAFQCPRAGGAGANRLLQLVEAGAHDGRLAADVLRWLRQFRPEIFARLEYWMVEPSPTRQEWQRRTLGEFAPCTRWAVNIADLRAQILGGVKGVIFSNELLDAMPAHRLSWEAAKRSWREWRVAGDGQNFTWHFAQPRPEAMSQIPQLPSGLEAALPEGFTIDVCPAVVEWWRQAAAALNCGKLLTLDYGLMQEEFFKPERSRGTLRAYWQHHISDNLLANVGEQDLTTHVNFSALQIAGEAEGLATKSLTSQSKFLTFIAGKTWEKPERFEKWTAQRVKEFQTLTHPEHLGQAFRVLIQSHH
jgi:SAM-dependent MidA family methyltransferase